MGLEGLLHTDRRVAHFTNILTRLGEHQRGTAEWMAEAFLKTTGGDPVALLHILQTFADTPLGDRGLRLADAGRGGRRRLRQWRGRRAGRALPRGRYVEIPGNHMASVTKPELGAAIAQFLTA